MTDKPLEGKKHSVEKIKYDIDPPEEIRALRNQIKSLQASLDKYKEEHGALEVLMHDVVEATDVLKAPKIVYSDAEGSAVSSPIAKVSHITDWHAGAVQDEDEIEKLNAFSPDILNLRIMHHADQLIKINEINRSAYVVDELHIICTGDMINGEIHEEFIRTNAFDAPVQLVFAANLMAAYTSKLSPHFEKVVLHLLLVDNHARLTKGYQHKRAGYNTFNFPMAIIVREKLKEHKNVEVRIYPRASQTIKIKNRQYLIVHGHQVRGWAGFPYYGIQRKAGKEATKRMRHTLEQAQQGMPIEEAIGTLYNKIIMGHWHAPLTHPWYWIGGAASGTDTYDHDQGREAIPLQVSWYIHPKKGEFNRNEWDLRTGEERKIIEKHNLRKKELMQLATDGEELQ